jgi:hypothetical protein
MLRVVGPADAKQIDRLSGFSGSKQRGRVEGQGTRHERRFSFHVFRPRDSRSCASEWLTQRREDAKVFLCASAALREILVQNSRMVWKTEEVERGKLNTEAAEDIHPLIRHAVGAVLMKRNGNDRVPLSSHRGQARKKRRRVLATDGRG